MNSPDRTELNVGMKCIKYMIFVINFMFVLTAILLITVGTAIQTIYGDFGNFIDDHFLSPANLMVAIGIIMLFVAVFGCVGAVKESTLMINIYAVLLTIIFILEVAAAISAFALQGQIQEMLERTMNESLEMYPQSSYIRESVDFMQNSLECCGVNNYSDWKGILPLDEDDENSENILKLPASCCATYQDETCLPYRAGCMHKLHFIVSQSAVMIATGSTTVCLVQILGVICAFMLAKTIRRAKSVRAARRWQLQQSLGIMVKQYDPEYTQMEKSEKTSEPTTYLPNSPSIIH